MVKFKTTKKAVMTGNAYVYGVGYCDLQRLLRYHEPVAYTSGTYGWNADIYQIDSSTVIVTGYRSFGAPVDYNLTHKYEKQAQALDETFQRDLDANNKATED